MFVSNSDSKSTGNGKGKGLGALLTREDSYNEQQRFSIMEVAADWHGHGLLVPQRGMQPSIASDRKVPKARRLVTSSMTSHHSHDSMTLYP